MNDETLAALEAGALSLEAEAALIWNRSPGIGEQYLLQAALIRALIERERNGGERAQIVALKLALKEARDVFQHYGDLHAAKPDPVKAQRNYDLAAKMDAALGEQP